MMTSAYRAPLDDVAFTVFDLLDAPRAIAELPAYAEVDEALMRSVIEEAGRFAGDVLAPINSGGDRAGCRLEGGEVRTPPGFASAYRAFWQAGWPSLACDPAWGGQGLPHLLNGLLYEFLCSANHAWTMYPGLLHGAYECLDANASPEIKRCFLPKLASGEWLGTMALTEPQAGSDLGLVRTRAEPAADGAWRITGDKIFISGADQDLSSNIVHLVLARLPDAPPGTRGLSLFVAPKFLPPYDDGRVGARNAITVTAIEHKMGLAGSATCAVRFEGATGWLVGEPHRGLAAMFVMMNAARLHVAIQGVGHMEGALQRACAYAAERPQMKAPGGGGVGPDPIERHPAVARLLSVQRAWTEGGRMLACWIALLLDRMHGHPDATERARAADRVALLTPLAKALLTENGFQCASLALQVFGGHGYVRETGIEQHLRDARITMIYEGTNEIQAIDLLVKKVVADGGARLAGLLDEIDADCGDDRDAADPHARALRARLRRLREATDALIARSRDDARAPFEVADEFLRALGVIVTGWWWLRAERASASAEGDADFLARKRATARTYFARLLPQADASIAVLESDFGAQSGVD